VIGSKRRLERLEKLAGAFLCMRLLAQHFQVQNGCMDGLKCGILSVSAGFLWVSG